MLVLEQNLQTRRIEKIVDRNKKAKYPAKLAISPNIKVRTSPIQKAPTADKISINNVLRAENPYSMIL